MTRALVVIDVQVDFCEGGALAVAGGNAVAERIAALLASDHGYDTVAATRDWHVEPGRHFSDAPDYGAPGRPTAWPARPARSTTRRCATRCRGSGRRRRRGLQQGPVRRRVLRLRRGRQPAAALSAYLRGLDVGEVDVVGIATDHCVRATAKDAAGLGFRTRVLLDLAAGVAPATVTRALDELRDAGVELVG